MVEDTLQEGGEPQKLAAICARLLRQDAILYAHSAALPTGRAAFDILIDLYIAAQAGESRCIWDVCQAAFAPISTAQRKINQLVASDLVMRSGSQADRRRVVVSLTPAGSALVDRIVGQLSEQTDDQEKGRRQGGR